MKLPFQNTYWVIEGKLMAGMYPGGFSEASILHRMQDLSELGIKSIINLTDVEEEINYFTMIYSDQCERFEEIYCRELLHTRYKVKDMDIPSRELMENILDKIDEDITNGHPVYLHCIGGTGRTGTVVGCYLLRHKMVTKEEVFEKILLLRGDGKESPETEEQRQFILNW
ncbi:MAG: dual specificity protein phosphatase family protein [Candidatus Delongbacteria bacterium]|jgi:protein-tyrosine phosphatase|nr:dual specificity protein phosphatase family protein [Candidatus Delongbacteria bacterium]